MNGVQIAFGVCVAMLVVVVGLVFVAFLGVAGTIIGVLGWIAIGALIVGEWRIALGLFSAALLITMIWG